MDEHDTMSPSCAYKGFVCGIIKMAVDDYMYCVDNGYIVDGKPDSDKLYGQYLIGLNIAACDVPILVDFFWTGRLHKLVSDSDLSVHPTRILSRIEPDRWEALLTKHAKIDVRMYE